MDFINSLLPEFTEDMIKITALSSFYKA